MDEDRLNPQVRRALGKAEAAARYLHHGFIDTEHLLLGLMAEPDSLASRALHDMGLEVATLASYVRQLYQGYPLPTDEQPIAYANGIARALSLAEEEAVWLGHDTVGAEHLLLGLTRWQEGGVVRMLKALGVAPGRVRRRVRQMQHAVQLSVGLEDLRRMTSISELAHRVLNGAIGEAARLGHGTVGVEHLLLVLCLDRRNVAGDVLRGLGIDVVAAESLVAQLAFPSPLAPVFGAAVAEAARLGDHYIGTDHLLLAMCQDTAGAEVLRYLGADPAQAQSRLREIMRG